MLIRVLWLRQPEIRHLLHSWQKVGVQNTVRFTVTDTDKEKKKGPRVKWEFLSGLKQLLIRCSVSPIFLLITRRCSFVWPMLTADAVQLLGSLYYLNVIYGTAALVLQAADARRRCAWRQTPAIPLQKPSVEVWQKAQVELMMDPKCTSKPW